MRKLILIAAISLLTTQAHAGGARSLSLAAANPSQQATEQPAATVNVPPQTTPAANVQTATAAPTATLPAATAPATTTPPRATAAPTASSTATARPKRRQPSVEARVIRELHRHGIYW